MAGRAFVRGDVPVAKRPIITPRGDDMADPYVFCDLVPHCRRQVGHTGRCETAFVVRLPFTKALSLNDRTNHWVKASAVKEWRQAAMVLARAHAIPQLGRCRIELHYVPRDKRRRDVLNLVASLKPLEDGLVDAKVVPDDTPEYIEPVMPTIHPAVREVRGGRFWLVVFPLDTPN